MVEIHDETSPSLQYLVKGISNEPRNNDNITWANLLALYAASELNFLSLKFMSSGSTNPM